MSIVLKKVLHLKIFNSDFLIAQIRNRLNLFYPAGWVKYKINYLMKDF